MRIGHIAPILFNIPAGRSGPTRVFVDLNEELYKLNPDLTVFACKNSRISGRLKWLFDQELNSLPDFEQANRIMRGLFFIEHVAAAYAQKKEIDVYLHHYDRWGLPLARLVTDRPSVIVMHNVNQNTFKRLGTFNAPHIHFVCLSEAIAAIFRRHASNVSVIHNGIDVRSIKPSDKKSDYFLFLGRLTPPKAPDIAIDICLEKKKKLVIIGKPVLDTEEMAAYFHDKIEPKLKDPLIKYLPEVDHDKVFQYYRQARALIFPMRDYIYECMPLTVPESLASGTPVLSLRNPLSAELINHGQTGFLGDNPVELASYLERVDELKPEQCRAAAETEFSREVMARRYYQLLQRLHSHHQ